MHLKKVGTLCFIVWFFVNEARNMRLCLEFFNMWSLDALSLYLRREKSKNRRPLRSIIDVCS